MSQGEQTDGPSEKKKKKRKKASEQQNYYKPSASSIPLLLLFMKTANSPLSLFFSIAVALLFLLVYELPWDVRERERKS